MSSVTVKTKSMIDLFDSAFLDYVNANRRYGSDSIVTNDYRSQCFGILRALRRAGIVNESTVLEVLDCIYQCSIEFL